MARNTPPAGNGPLFDDRSEEGADALASKPRRRVPRNLGLVPVALVVALVGTGLWGAWVTKELLADSALPPIAKVQLSTIVGEYVQAQARSATPPDQVTAETRAFMAEIERNLKARGAGGQIVLVGEAVLAGEVPDITADLRREIYARVKMPQPAAADAGDVMGAMRAAIAAPAGEAGSGIIGGAANAPVN